MRLSPVALTTLAASGIYILVNLFTYQLEFDSSNKLAYSLQTAGGDGIAKIFFLLITYFGFPISPCLPVLPILVLRDKWVPFKVVFLFAISGYLIGFLKIIYGGPRPWWISEQIKVFNQCSVTDFGRPSGHAFISAYAFMLMFKFYIYDDQSQTYTERIRTEEIEILIDEADEKTPESIDAEVDGVKQQKKVFKLSKLDRPLSTEWTSMKTFWITTGIFLSVSIGFSRVYLGAHSYEQILLGWAYATVFYIFTVYWLDEQTDKLFLYFLDGRHRNHNFKLFASMTALYVLMLTLPLVMLKSTEAARAANKKDWVKNMRIQCGDIFTQEFPMDSMSLYLCSIGVIAFGMIFGMMFAKDNIMLISKLLTLTQVILRKIVGLLVFGIVAATCYFFVPTNNYIVFYFVNLNACSLLVTLSAYLIVPPLLKALKLNESLTTEEIARHSDYVSF